MQKQKSGNLVVIIGNGFDLAHGLKTGFSDFAKYYIDKIIYPEIGKALKTGNSSILEKTFIDILRLPDISAFRNTTNLTDNKRVQIEISHLARSPGDKSVNILFLLRRKGFVASIITNSFLKTLYSDNFPNWFDIEQAYYSMLKDFYSNKSWVAIERLNDNLSESEESFKQYLTHEIRPNVNEHVNHSFTKHFKDRREVTFINFNYTKTLDLYDSKGFSKIHIHGELDNEIIFGYGDDTDETYLKMKNERNKELLRNFKTYGYLKSSPYKVMLNKLAVFNDYDCLVVGHSLDLTDKTILKTILDSEKCNYIELLKRSDLENEQAKYEAHFELHANLARIFSHETDLRKKLISYDQSIHFPLIQSGDDEKVSEREKILYNGDVFFF